jgi:heterodisulfide reductase subunit A-like polyferredoxin
MDEYYVESENCCGCEACVNECSVQAIRVEDRVAVIDKENCLRCGACASVCPMGAIQSR